VYESVGMLYVALYRQYARFLAVETMEISKKPTTDLNAHVN
jgi:hypothetical protein